MRRFLLGLTLSVVGLPSQSFAQPTPPAPPAAPSEPVQAPSEPAPPPAAPSEPAPPPAAPSEPAPPPVQDEAPPAPQAPSDAPAEPSPSEPAPIPEPPVGSPTEPAERAPEPPPPAEPPPAEPPPAEPPPAEPKTAVVNAPQPAVPEETEPVEVIVAGSRLNRAAGSAQVIGQRQLQRFGYDDPHAVLLQVPGVYVRQEDGMGLRPNISLRGANPDRSKKVTLMEDGILFGPAPYSAPAAYYFPLTTRMTQVRVIKGPAAIAYGPQTVGGAIDFVTRAIPSQPSGALELALGEYGYDKVHAHFGASNEQFGFLAEGVRLHNTGFKRLPDANADTGATRNEWMAKFSYVLDPQARNHNEFGLKLSYSDEVSNETYLGITDADFRADPYQRYQASALDRMKNQRFAVVLSHRFEVPSAGLELSSALYRHVYERTWRKLNRFSGAPLFPAIEASNEDFVAVLRGEQDSATGSDNLFVGPNARSFVSEGAQSVLELNIGSGPIEHSAQAGVRFHRDSIERHHSEDEFLMLDGRLVPAGTATNVTTVDRDQTHALALHALDALTFRGLTLTPGARVELIWSESDDRKASLVSDAFVFAVLPGIGAYYALSDQLGVLAGVYRGFSPPPPGANQDVEPEYSVNYEAGARWSSGPQRVELIGFFNDYSNLTDVCTLSSSCVDAGLDEQFDAGAARIYGLEAYASYVVPAGALTLPLTAAYTLTRAEFLSAFDSLDPIYGRVERGDELPYVPRHQASLSVGLDGRFAGGALGAYYVAPMREEAGSGPIDRALATDPQTWLDLSAYVKPMRGISLYGNLRNALAAKDIVSRRPYGARPNAPRWLQVGAKLSF